MIAVRSSVCALVVAAILLAFSITAAFAANASERRFIRSGMSEAEVLATIGKPDSESNDYNNFGVVTLKRWIYLPTEDDREMLTTVVMQSGQVIDVTRRLQR